MASLTITAVYALPLAAIYLVLWFRVTQMRAALGISIGDAGNPTLHERIRCHGNFVEWVPMVLILMIIASRWGPMRSMCISLARCWCWGGWPIPSG